MAASLEVRMPYLDRAVRDLAQSLRRKETGTTAKALIVAAMRRRLPASLVDRIAARTKTAAPDALEVTRHRLFNRAAAISCRQLSIAGTRCGGSRWRRIGSSCSTCSSSPSWPARAPIRPSFLSRIFTSGTTASCERPSKLPPTRCSPGAHNTRILDLVREPFFWRRSLDGLRSWGAAIARHKSRSGFLKCRHVAGALKRYWGPSDHCVGWKSNWSSPKERTDTETRRHRRF